MVRTAAAGIRVSAGKSSKKVGGGSGSSTQSSGSSNKSKTGSSSSKLPPIPFQETPTWQKPITNFFKTDGPLKATKNKSEENKDKENINNDNKAKDVSNTVAENSDVGPRKKLKLDSEAESNNHEKMTEEGQEAKEQENKTCVETSETNKENASKSTAEFDEGAGSSKD